MKHGRLKELKKYSILVYKTSRNPPANSSVQKTVTHGDTVSHIQTNGSYKKVVTHSSGGPGNSINTNFH